MTEVVIAAAARTPVGSFNGALSGVSAHYLGEVAIVEAMKRAKVEPGEVSEVIMGQILAAGAGQNPARQAAVAAGIPVERTAYGINQLCGSGLRAVALGLPGDQGRRQRDRRRRRPGEHEPGAALHASAQRHEDGQCRARRHDDQGRAVGRLQRLSHGQHRRERRPEMADHARAAGQFRRWARSRRRRPRRRPGRFKDEIVPVKISTAQGRGRWSTPTNIPSTARRSMRSRSCAPAFDKNGTVTAGNASGINDGARGDRADDATRTRPSAGSSRSRASCRGRPPASIPRSWARARSRPRARR